MLMASALIPFAPALAKGVLMTFFILHAIVAVLIIRSFLLGPTEQRRVTPVWHLSFVGFIIGAVPALGLGWTGLASAIFYTTLPIAAAIWLVSALQLARADVPAPLRPLLAIHLAPVALFAIVSAGLGFEGAAMSFGWLAITVFAVMLAAARYLTKSGFSALWGAFTFPLGRLRQRHVCGFHRQADTLCGARRCGTGGGHAGHRRHRVQGHAGLGSREIVEADQCRVTLAPRVECNCSKSCGGRRFSHHIAPTGAFLASTSMQ